MKPTFGDQVARYLGTTHGVADPNALYVAEFGGNDIRDALETVQSAGDPFAVIGGAMQALDGLLVQLAAAGLEIYCLDLFNFIDVATDMPQGFGIADASTPCLQVFVAPASEVCDDPDQHLFWDGIHPTRAGHRLVGNIAGNQLSLN